jgi:hypothetical protein
VAYAYDFLSQIQDLAKAQPAAPKPEPENTKPPTAEEIAEAEATYAAAVTAQENNFGSQYIMAKRDAALALRKVKYRNIKARLAAGESVNSILTSSNDKELAFNLIMLNTPKNKLLNLLTTVINNFPTIGFQATTDVMTYAPDLIEQIKTTAINAGLDAVYINNIGNQVNKDRSEVWNSGFSTVYIGTSTIQSNFGGGGTSCRLIASCN